MVVRWFKLRRGRALGLLAISTSAAGFLLVPVVALLIEHFGWRDALLQLGLAAGALVLAITLLGIRDRPQGTEPGYDREFGTGERRIHRRRAWKVSGRFANCWAIAISGC